MYTEKGVTLLNTGEIETLTIKWLERNGLKVRYANNVYANNVIERLWLAFFNRLNPSKQLTIEKGNPYLSDTRFTNWFRWKILNINRFQSASRRSYKYFMEDTPENAIKLSLHCEYVFLFDQPYNKETNYNFPDNVIRVSDWNDVL